MNIRLIALAALGPLTLALAACSSSQDITISKIFLGPPWKGIEVATYDVQDKGVKGSGSCTLTTTPDAEPGKTRLDRECSKDEFRDRGSALVDSATLRPFSSSRVYEDSKKGDRTTHTITYDEPVAATFTTDDGRKRRETVRDLPKPDSKSPDPAYYDDESLLWLARGINLKTGYQAAYAHVINAGQPRILTVEVRVEVQESVSVPAGKFTTWRIRYQREDSIYYVWVDAAAPNRMVKARIEDVIYELTAIKQ